jgi:hypothetical protein
MASRDWVSAPGAAPNHVTGPEALRCPELHDFSDLHGANGRIDRPIIIVLAVAALLTIGHFLYHGLEIGNGPIAHQQAQSTHG